MSGSGSSRRAQTGRAAVIFVAVALAATDLAAKAWAEARLDGSTVDLGALQLKLAHNSGVAFSAGARLPSGLLVVITLGLTAGIVAYCWRRAPHAGWIEWIAGGAAIGGATANVIDRGLDGMVTDYLHTGWWPTFNLADTFLVAGFITIALARGRADVAPPKLGIRDDDTTADTDASKRTGVAE